MVPAVKRRLACSLALIDGNAARYLRHAAATLRLFEADTKYDAGEIFEARTKIDLKMRMAMILLLERLLIVPRDIDRAL